MSKFTIKTSEALNTTTDEFFLAIAKDVSSCSTCLSVPVGAVIVKKGQILSTGYNAPPLGSPQCSIQGYCYHGLEKCGDSKELSSRAIHAEVDAITRAAKQGISVQGATLYTTLEPCLSCLKLIISSGIKEVIYNQSFNQGKNAVIIQDFVREGLVTLKQVNFYERNPETRI